VSEVDGGVVLLDGSVGSAGGGSTVAEGGELGEGLCLVPLVVS